MIPKLKLTNLTFFMKNVIINIGIIKKVSDNYGNDKKTKKTIFK